MLYYHEIIFKFIVNQYKYKKGHAFVRIIKTIRKKNMILKEKNKLLN